MEKVFELSKFNVCYEIFLCVNLQLEIYYPVTTQLLNFGPLCAFYCPYFNTFVLMVSFSSINFSQGMKHCGPLTVIRGEDCYILPSEMLPVF